MWLFTNRHIILEMCFHPHTIVMVGKQSQPTWSRFICKKVGHSAYTLFNAIVVGEQKSSNFINIWDIATIVIILCSVCALLSKEPNSGLLTTVLTKVDLFVLELAYTSSISHRDNRLQHALFNENRSAAVVPLLRWYVRYWYNNVISDTWWQSVT